jgi:effector-binding domain-containing protein
MTMATLAFALSLAAAGRALLRVALACALGLGAAGLAAAQSAPPAQSPAAEPSAQSSKTAPTISPPPSADGSIAVIDVAPVAAVGMQGDGRWDDSYGAIARSLESLRAAAKSARLSVSGHPLVVFLITDDAGFRFQALLPLSDAPESAGADPDFRIVKSPGGRAVKFEHRSAYDEIDATYEAITAWLDDRNLVAQDFFVEEWVKPGDGPDDMNAEIDIYVFIK